MTTLRDRKLRVQIDTVLIEGVTDPGMHVLCKAVRSLAKEPNKCEVQVYNLSPEHRASLMAAKLPVVSVSAGYEGAMTQIFLGQAIHVRNENRRPDIVTTVSTSDSGTEARGARTKVSFPKGVKPGDVLKILARDLKVKPGNLNDAIRKLNSGKAASIYAEGCQVIGHVPAYLTELCRSAGLEWSIQDGALQFLEIGKALAQTALVIDESLLLDTPSVTSKNVIEFTTFIQADIVPGRQVHIQHRDLKMIARIEKCSYDLDSHAEPWYVQVEAKGIK